MDKAVGRRFTLLGLPGNKLNQLLECDFITHFYSSSVLKNLTSSFNPEAGEKSTTRLGGTIM